MRSESNGIFIREAIESDWQAIWPLLSQMGKVNDRESVRARFLQLLEWDNHYMPVASVSQELIGYAWAQDFGPHFRSGIQGARLHDLFVDPGWRRRGVGKTLFEIVKSWGRKRGVMELQWQVSVAALPFYYSLGLLPKPAEDPAHPYFSIEL